MLLAHSGDAAHELVARGTQDGIDAPGLQVSAGRRADGEREDLFQRLAGDGIGLEGADRLARGDGGADGQGRHVDLGSHAGTPGTIAA